MIPVTDLRVRPWIVSVNLIPARHKSKDSPNRAEIHKPSRNTRRIASLYPWSIRACKQRNGDVSVSFASLLNLDRIDIRDYLHGSKKRCTPGITRLVSTTSSMGFLITGVSDRSRASGLTTVPSFVPSLFVADDNRSRSLFIHRSECLFTSSNDSNCAYHMRELNLQNNESKTRHGKFIERLLRRKRID